MDIIKDPEFVEVSAVYQAKISLLKREGKARTQHKPPTNSGDIKKLQENRLFSSSQAETLHAEQGFLWSDVCFFFCRRGRQNLRGLKDKDFGIGTDWYGIRYVNNVKDELTKNRLENDEAQETQIMFETGTSLCPFSFDEKNVHLNRKNG